MNKTVLHLERKFTSNTETFIVNQINTLKNYVPVVTCFERKNYLKCDKEFITPNERCILSSAKYLSRKTASYFLNEIRTKEISLVHCHYITDAYYFSKITKHLNVPKIVSAYGYDVSEFPYSFFGLSKFFYRKIFKEYDYFLAMSHAMKEDLIKIGCPESKIVIHYHGINAKRFCHNKNYNKNNNTLKLLTVASLEEIKGHKYVLLAFYKLINEYGLEGLEYTLIGDGRVKSLLLNLVNKLGISKYVSFKGHVPHNSEEMLKYYRESDIFLHPSIVLKKTIKEGIPGAIVEAMASGLPVISTYHAGIPYIIENEKEGLLVKERDVDELASALYRLITDAGLREKLGKNAQKKAVDDLSLESGTRELEEIYERAIREFRVKS